MEFGAQDDCSDVPMEHSTPIFAPSSASTGPLLLADVELFEDNQHGVSLLHKLAAFRDQGFMCDVQIKVDKRLFSCHRSVLAAAIPYFESMFASEMRETKQKEIIIQDISADAFENILSFAYTSRVKITSTNVQELLYAASILQIDTVASACEKFLTSYLTVQNCLAIRTFAHAHNLSDLVGAIDQFTREHFLELSMRPEFLTISFPHLMDLISSSDLHINEEREVLSTVMLWVETETSQRSVHLPQLLAGVRLAQLPCDALLGDVRAHPLIRAQASCRELVTDALEEKLQCNLATVERTRRSAPSIPTTIPSVNESTAAATGIKCYTPTPDVTSAPVSFAKGSDLADVFPTTSAVIVPKPLTRPRKSAAGVIFCVGGRGTSGDPFRTVEAYDWLRDQWVAVPEMGIRRRHVGVVSAYGKLYAIGGHDGVEHLDSAECFDPVTGLWRPVAAMETRRRGIALGTLEGAIYAVGGLDDGACFQTVERYDIEADRWSPVESMNVQRGGVGVAALVGGNDGTSSLDSCERYDPHLNKWKNIASMVHRRAGAGVTVLDGCLYAIGGFDDNAPLKSCERYDPLSDTWTVLPNMSCPRGGVGVAAMGGRLYAVGGHDGLRYLNSVEAYDSSTQRWTVVKPIAQCRAGAGVAWCDCSIGLLSDQRRMAAGCCPKSGGVAYCV